MWLESQAKIYNKLGLHSRERRNGKAYLDGQYHKEVSFFLLRVLKTKPVKLLNFHFCHFLSRLTRETKL